MVRQRFPPLDASHHRLSTNQKLWHLSAVHAEPLNTWLLGWCTCKYLTADIGGGVRERVEFCWNESRWCHGEVWIHRTGLGVLVEKFEWLSGALYLLPRAVSVPL